jgi:hypothetical protein
LVCALLSRFGADARFAFNAKTPRWLNALRSPNKLATGWLMPRSLFLACSVWDGWRPFMSNAPPARWTHTKSRSGEIPFRGQIALLVLCSKVSGDRLGLPIDFDVVRINYGVEPRVNSR